MILKSKSHLINDFILSILLSFCVYFIASLNIIVGLLLFISFSVTLVYYKFFRQFSLFFLIVTLLQNTFIAYSSSIIVNKEMFTALHGINFFVIVCYFFVGFGFNKASKRIMLINVINLSILAFYAIAGIFLYGFVNSILYLRLFSIPLFMLSIGYYFSSLISKEYLNKFFNFLLTLILITSALQFIFPNFITFLLNDTSYYGLKAGALNSDEVVGYLGSNSYFNLPWDIKLIRSPGLIKSFISSAYLIVILSIYLYWGKNWIKFVLSVSIMIIAVASKGALLLLILFILINYFRKVFSLNIAVIVLVAFWIFAIIIGHSYMNEHTIGFVAGLKHLTTLGNGLGFGGNLSNIRLSSWNGTELSDIGYWTRFQNGSESAWGVCMSSLGIFSVLYLASYVYIIRHKVNSADKSYGDKSITLLAILGIAQGIFQEEAFSPYALGLIMFLFGFDLGLSGLRKLNNV